MDVRRYWFCRISLVLAGMFSLANALDCQIARSDPTVSQRPADSREWLKRVRIAAYPLSSTNADTIVREAKESGVYGIEVDNDIPGRYESLLHPEAKLEALRKISAAAHTNGQKTFVYIAGFECISAHAASPHTLFKEHPEWMQRKITGEPALFDTKAAFWIAKGEEDTWVSPYAKDWRALYMARVRQIAGTGIDGIYIDIPYWMTHFTGWEDSWASFDDATVEAFKKQTGLDARHDLKLGDFADTNFRKWIDFRINTITDFLSEVRRNATNVNPSISIIPEIYPGIEQESVRVGADVYQIYPVVDAIAHEYEFGEGDDHTAASRSPFDWMMYQIGMRSFRAFAGDKPTWILNYSWDGASHVKPADAMQTLFMSELMAGANVWDASGHVMSGSNDMAVRRVAYEWIARHEDIFGASRTPIGDVGVYFSEATRNYYPKEFLESYRGTLLLLLQAHRQFVIVTPRTLNQFRGKALVLPNVRVANTEEADQMKQLASSGVHLVLTGDTDHVLKQIDSADYLPADPARSAFLASEANFSSDVSLQAVQLLTAIGGASSIRVAGTRNLVVHASEINQVPHLFFANFEGIRPGQKLTPDPQINITIEVPASYGTTMHVLPFLGNETELRGQAAGDSITFVVPRIDRGAVAWFK